ncbi:MAG: M15 family metallopeptidase [Rubrivivax sp.]|nr:M15 family metallopeptidase [Rubrivivax sp.]
MLIAGVIVYFLLVLAGLVWWLLPRVRERARARLGGAVQAGRDRRQTLRARAQARRVKAGLANGPLAPELWRERWAAMYTHRHSLAAALALLIALPALALLLRQSWQVDTYDHTASRDVNPQVAALLRGEQLVPPAPLPPELFLTREVMQVRPMAGSANRQWELLDAEFRQRLLGVFKLMREQHGFEMVLIEGYRSPARQTELLGFGPQVTHAAAGQSLHQHGRAADNAFLIDGKIVISEAHPKAARGYALYGAVAQSFGLTWGGGWRSLKDLGHVELRAAAVANKP